jgi:hypothetical protein
MTDLYSFIFVPQYNANLTRDIGTNNFFKRPENSTQIKYEINGLKSRNLIHLIKYIIL